MKNILSLILLLPLFFACSNDNESDLVGTKWLYNHNSSQYFWKEVIEFKSNSECDWTTITKGYGPGYGNTSNQSEGQNDGLIYTVYHFTYSTKNTEIYLSNKENDNIKAQTNLESGEITIGDKIFKKQ